MGAATLRSQIKDHSGVYSPAMVLARNTGIGLPAAVFRDRVARERRMLDADLILAEKLEKPEFSFDDSALHLLPRKIQAIAGRRLTWVGDVTGKSIPLSPLRDINIFESVMQRHRSFYLKELEFFGANCPGRKYFRYSVITTAHRIAPGDDLYEAKREAMAKISRWQRIIRKRWDIEVLLNVCEYTFDKDSRTFFVHFNVLLWPHRALSKTVRWTSTTAQNGKIVRLPISEFQEYLTFSWQFLGVHWQDNGIVKDFSELLKYVLKGHENGQDGTKKSIDPRKAMTTQESHWLYHQLFRRRFIVAYGSFKAAIAERRASRQKLSYIQIDRSGAKELRIVQLPALEEKTDKPESDASAIRETENLIRGRTSPLCRVSAWAEPGTLIEGYNPQPETGGGKRRLADAREAARESVVFWQANGAPDPATAIAVSEAWLLAPDDMAAAAIVPALRPRPGHGASRVHTTDLTLTTFDELEAYFRPPPDPGGSSEERATEKTARPNENMKIILWTEELTFLERGGFAHMPFIDFEEEQNPCEAARRFKTQAVLMSFGSFEGRDKYPHIVLTASGQWFDVETGETFPISQKFRTA